MQHLRQHLPPTQSQQYVCCYNPSTSGPLIMLANHQHIFTNVLKDTVQPYYFWLYSNSRIPKATISQLSNQIKSRSIVFTTIAQIHEFLTTQNEVNFKKIIFISSKQFKDDLSAFAQKKQFLGVVLFDVKKKCRKNKQRQKEEVEAESLEVEEIYKGMTWKNMTVCKDSQQLNSFLNVNQWNTMEANQFPNFISLKQEVQKSTVLYRTMIAMIKSQIEGQTRSQILSHLEHLIITLAKHNPKLSQSMVCISQAIQTMKKNKQQNEQCKHKRIITYYTDEKYRFYIILNTFLRAMDCPTQIFCVQPFFKELFEAVQFFNDYISEQITCYRGSSVNNVQILKFQNNIGEIVQNLGFMSSSKSYQSAISFKKNIFYKIYVPGKKKGTEKIKQGFANISGLSVYLAQQQILFNPLCYFLLTQLKQSSLKHGIGQQPKIEYQICLSYIDINEEIKKQQEDQSDKITKILVSLLEQMHGQFNSQCDVLLQPENKAQVQKSWMYCKLLISRDEKLMRILNSIETQKKWNLSMEMKSEDNIGLKILEDQMEMSIDEICHYLKLIKNIGSILYFTGHCKQALDFYYKCLDIQKNMLNDTGSNYLSTLNKIALTKIELGKAQEVLQIYRAVELTGREILGQKNANYLKYCNNIVLVLSMLTRYSEAFNYFTKWENLAKQVFSQYHPVYIKNLINKAHILLKLCRYEQAYDISKKCQFLMRNVLREDNFYYISILHQMVNCLTKLSRFSQAEIIYKKNEKIMRQIVGENNPKYFLNMASLGSILFEQGKYEEALTILKSCLDIVKSNFGENTRYYTFILSKIGDSLLAQGKHIQALDFYRKCQLIERGLYDNNSPTYLMNYIRIGTAFMRRGYYKQALQIFKQTQKELRIKLGYKHPHYLLILKSICQAYIRLRRNSQALEYCREIEMWQKQICGDKDTINYLLGMNMTGDALVQNQKVDEGLKYFLQFQSKFKNIYGERHPYYFGGVARIANAFIIKCKFNEAFELFTQKINQGLLHSKNQSHVLILKVIMNFFICLGDYVALLALFFKFKSQFMSRYFYCLSKILQLTKMYKQLKFLLRLSVRQIESKGNKTRSRDGDSLLRQYRQTFEAVKIKQSKLQRKINNKCFLNF